MYSTLPYQHWGLLFDGYTVPPSGRDEVPHPSALSITGKSRKHKPLIIIAEIIECSCLLEGVFVDAVDYNAYSRKQWFLVTVSKISRI